MKMSHVALLSVLFVAPAFASQAPDPAPQGPLSQLLTTVIVNPFNFVENKTLAVADFVAGWTVNPILNKIVTNVSFLQGGTIQSYFGNDATTGINPMGRAMVLVGAAYLAYQAYLALNAQNNSDDEVIFGDEYADVN